MDRKLLQTPLPQCQEDVFLTFLTSSFYKDKFLDGATFRTHMKKGHREADTAMIVRSAEKGRKLCLLEPEAKKFRSTSFWHCERGVRNILRSKSDESARCLQPRLLHHCAGPSVTLVNPQLLCTA